LLKYECISFFDDICFTLKGLLGELGVGRNVWQVVMVVEQENANM
jgi:hypothetical protein